jgi:uncharacterized protein (DUF983 family)
MGDGKHCPNCGKDIGVWPVFSAGWPSLIWCPRCKSRLRYRKTAPVIAVLLVVLIVIAAAAFVLVSYFTTRWWRPIWAMVMIISWVPVQLAVTWFLRNRRELELAARSRTER